MFPGFSLNILQEPFRGSCNQKEINTGRRERDSPGADSGEGTESIPADCGQGAVLAERNECKVRHYFRGFGGMRAGAGRLTTKFCVFRQSSGSGMARAVSSNLRFGTGFKEMRKAIWTDRYLRELQIF